MNFHLFLSSVFSNVRVESRGIQWLNVFSYEDVSIDRHFACLQEFYDDYNDANS